MGPAGFEPSRIQQSGGKKEDTYTAVFNSAADAIILFSVAIIDCNVRATELFRCPSDQLVGAPIEGFFPELQSGGEASAVSWLEFLERAKRGEKFTFPWIFHLRDGSLLESSVSLSVMTPAAGTTIIALIRETTNGPLGPLLALRSQLESVNAEMDSLCYSVSHDLRAVTHGIAACARIILDDHFKELGGEAAAWLRHIRDDALNLDRYTEALIELSRISRSPIVPELVDFSELVQERHRLLTSQHPGRVVALRLSSGVCGMADRALAGVLIEKLLDNAWKFTAERPYAEIEFGLSANKAFFVRDNGIGFDVAQSHRLFVPFQRLHRSPAFDGSGVGLAIARRIVNRHQGRIWASAVPNEGATFYVELDVSMR